MEINILTLFPEMFAGPLSLSIIKRAIERNAIKINLINIRDFAEDLHKTVDDTPYGGGAGMLMKVDILDRAIKNIVGKNRKDFQIILMTPQGVPFKQEKAVELSKYDRLIFICGHYEGFDERIREHLVDEEISLGDFILSGGEIPAMAIIDSVIRLIPGVLGKDESAKEETFSIDGKKLLEYPQYTRPVEYNDWKVPEILLSGNHQEIKKWRLEEAKKRTSKKRPDLSV
jgi:tRNA (guanine37-N1)-methyltransferase